MKQGGRYAAGDVHAADRVAERGDALRQRAIQALGGHRIADAAARPERGAVEAADIALRTFVAVGTAAGVDDVRVGGADVLDVEFHLLALRRQIVGEKYIGGLGNLVDQLDTIGRGDIDADAALAAIRVLDHGMAHRVDLHAADVDEAALRVAAHRMLDLDDVRAPVGQDRAGGGHEGVLRHLEHPHALHHLRHQELPFCGGRQLYYTVDWLRGQTRGRAANGQRLSKREQA